MRDHYDFRGGVRGKHAAQFGDETTMVRLDSVVVSNPEILGGEPVFVGTRVPVVSLFEWLEGGQTLDDWLANFPGVTREQASSVLADAKALIVAGARSSH